MADSVTTGVISVSGGMNLAMGTCAANVDTVCVMIAATVTVGSHEIIGDRSTDAGSFGKSGTGGGTAMALLVRGGSGMPLLLSDVVGNSACG